MIDLAFAGDVLSRAIPLGPCFVASDVIVRLAWANVVVEFLSPFEGSVIDRLHSFRCSG